MTSNLKQYLQDAADRAFPQPFGPPPFPTMSVKEELQNSPVVFSRYRRLYQVENPDTLPSRLIIDFGPELEEFHFSIADVENQELDISQIFDELLMYITDNAAAEEGILALADDMRRYHTVPGFDSGGDADKIAIATRQLAEKVLTRLRYLHMYTQSGHFPYVVKTWLDPMNVMLEKYIPSPLQANEGVSTAGLRITPTTTT